MEFWVWRTLLRGEILQYFLRTCEYFAELFRTLQKNAKKIKKFPIYTNRPKANRYKSPRENTTEIKEIDSTQKRSLPSQPQQASPRFGSGPIGLQKTPPDLQFGLAFTVPFVSLSTDKLINTFNGKSHNSNYGDVSNILKLNLSGLVIAAVVGIAAFLFIPSLIGGGKFGGSNSGWGNYGGSILDSLLPAGVLGGVLDHFGLGNHGGHSGGHGGHGWDENSGVSRPFGYQDYYEYNGVHNNRKGELALH